MTWRSACAQSQSRARSSFELRARCNRVVAAGTRLSIDVVRLDYASFHVHLRWPMLLSEQPPLRRRGPSSYTSRPAGTENTAAIVLPLSRETRLDPLGCAQSLLRCA